MYVLRVAVLIENSLAKVLKQQILQLCWESPITLPSASELPALWCHALHATLCTATSAYHFCLYTLRRYSSSDGYFTGSRNVSA